MKAETRVYCGTIYPGMTVTGSRRATTTATNETKPTYSNVNYKRANENPGRYFDNNKNYSFRTIQFHLPEATQ